MPSPLAPDRRAELVSMLRQAGYEHRAEPFQLSSGGWSHDYVDGKFAVASGASLARAASAALEALSGFGYSAVGGPTMGADALAHAIAVVGGCRWFSVRKEPKGHGRQSWVEGARLSAGDQVAMVEDVVSTGGSLLRAAEKISDLGVTVVAATALLDRSPEVSARFEAAGIAWRPLLTWEDLGIEPL